MFYLIVLKVLAAFVALTMAKPVPSFTFTNSSNPQRPKVRFNVRGQLKIAMFSDLHYGENAWVDWGPAQDIASTRVMRSVLDDEAPDFVFLTGDLVTGEDLFRENATSYIDMIVQPLVEGGYPWASVYGNHDTAANITRVQILHTEQRYRGSHTQHGPNAVSGVTNYFLDVYASRPPLRGSWEERNERPIMRWWFFDSRGGDNHEPNWVDSHVVKWFQREHARQQARSGVVPEIAVWHIPTHTYKELQATLDPLKCPGLNDDVPLVGQGENDSAFNYTGQDLPFIQALQETKTIRAGFVGHDHGNAWCCKWGHMDLCFNKHSGYGGYGDWKRGARILLLKEDDLVNGTRSWIRMEDHTIASAVSLDEAYGTDTEMYYDTYTGEY